MSVRCTKNTQQPPPSVTGWAHGNLGVKRRAAASVAEEGEKSLLLFVGPIDKEKDGVITLLGNRALTTVTSYEKQTCHGKTDVNACGP